MHIACIVEKQLKLFRNRKQMNNSIYSHSITMHFKIIFEKKYSFYFKEVLVRLGNTDKQKRKALVPELMLSCIQNNLLVSSLTIPLLLSICLFVYYAGDGFWVSPMLGKQVLYN
jgi:hypothetical protein